MDNGLEVGINKSGDLFSRGIVGRNNGVTSMVGFTNFREKVQSGSVRNKDMEKKRLGWKDHGEGQ